jgi:DNA-cytosine methyltransferase
MDIVVLSLFDGISCGRLTLNKSKFNVIRYYSSEIDDKAISIANYNFKDDMKYRLGDVKNIDVKKLKNEIKNEFGNDVKILLIGGSPCTDLSICGKRKGLEVCNVVIDGLDKYLELKNNDFEFEGQSYLFWEYIRIKNELEPDYFLLENVKMDKKWLEIFNKELGCEPIEINSKFFSAQNRKRLYWFNWDIKENYIDKKIYLNNILEKNVDEIYYIDEKYEYSLTEKYYEIHKKKLNIDKPVRIGCYNKCGQGDRIYSIYGKSVTLTANGGGRGGKTGIYMGDDMRVRKLTPLECERLQCLPDNFTKYGYDGKDIFEISRSNRYKAIGNGWTIDVITYILNQIDNRNKIDEIF